MSRPCRAGQKDSLVRRTAVRRKPQLRALGWIQVTACLLFLMVGNLAADPGGGGPEWPNPDFGTGGEPDTLLGGPHNPGSDGDPNDYDKTFPAHPDWLWIVGWLAGVCG